MVHQLFKAALLQYLPEKKVANNLLKYINMVNSVEQISDPHERCDKMSRIQCAFGEDHICQFSMTKFKCSPKNKYELISKLQKNN